MGFNFKGYVLEPPRVGQANSPFTPSPNNFIADAVAFGAVYPVDSEPSERADYLVMVLTDGLLVDAVFGWTKNEGIQRFEYDGREQRYRPLLGAPPVEVGVVDATINLPDTRLKVTPPKVVAPPAAPAPYRLSVGPNSGTTLTTSLVDVFGAPSAGTVEILSTTGQLNWNAVDLVTYVGQQVRFQRQIFYTSKESDAFIGLTTEALILNPLPAQTQIPLIRVGYGLYLISDEVANDAAFSPNPAVGHVEWSRTTGRLRFNSGLAEGSVYYDGVLLAAGLTLPRQNLGLVGGLSNITVLPQEGGSLIFRIPGVIQFPEEKRVEAFDTFGEFRVIQVLPVGAGAQVQLSTFDQAAYLGAPLQVVFGDLPIERGVSMRFFRTPVNLDASDPNIKDVTNIYSTTNATLADPIIGSPQVFLPVIPLDDPTYPIVVHVEQGTGVFLPGVLPRLDVLPLPPGPGPIYGYVLDLPKRIFQYAQRKNGNTVTLTKPSGAVALPEPLLIETNFLAALETGVGTGTYTPLTLGIDAILDAQAGVLSFTTTQGVEVTNGGTGSFVGTTFSDPAGAFGSVLAGDILIVPDGAGKGAYTVTTQVNGTTLTTDVAGVGVNMSYQIFRGREILADRFFQEALLIDPNTKVERIRLLGVSSAALQISLEDVLTTRFRFGGDVFSTQVTIVATDGDFSLPGALAEGQVEISLATGNLNLSSADVTSNVQVFSVRLLTQGRDYKIQAGFGLIEFTSRLLSLEEALITYTPLTGNGPAVSSNVERATFLVRGEISQDHPTVTNTVTFNPLQRTVASQPSPVVRRGGRPQDSTQISVDTALSKITFLPDDLVTDALPHGSVVNPDERIYIDYSIYEAMGGEKSVSVLVPPMHVAEVVLVDGETNFTVIGDQTTVFPSGCLLRVETERVYSIGASSYDALSNLTTVTLAAGATFQDSLNGPKLYVSSGPVRVQPALSFPSYFVTELTPYDAVARGMNKIIVAGDRTSAYRSGSVLLFTDGGATFQEFYQVSGVVLNAVGKTEITLTSNALRQYIAGVHTLKVSARPVLESSAKTTLASRSPVLALPYLVYRRIEGQVGQLLDPVDDYTIDETGQISFAPPLAPLEEIALLYTGHRLVGAGLRVQVSYTSIITPDSAGNGLLNQILQMDYSVYSPDTYYYRIETRTNFRAEVSKSISDSAKASAPSGGPNFSNASAPKLFEQGRESTYFPEGHYANQDLVARVMLKYYNDAVHYLEDVLRNLDGRVIGQADGRFLFDGKLDNPQVPAPPLPSLPPGPLPQAPLTLTDSTNHIDDRVLLTPFPVDTNSLPVFVFKGTWVPVFQPGPASRFYPTTKATFGITVGGSDTGATFGTEILDLGVKNVSTVPEVRRRSARARILKAARAGSDTLYTTTLSTTTELLRPAFVVGEPVDIIAEDGTPLSVNLPPDVLPLPQIVISALLTNPDRLVLSLPLSVDIPVGATVTVPVQEPLYPDPYVPVGKIYTVPLSFWPNFEKGVLLYPLDCTAQGFPPPTSNERIQTRLTLGNLLTSPLRFPALDGISLNDDSDESIPIVSPSFDCESLLSELIQDYVGIGAPAAGGYFQGPFTTPPYFGVGSLNVDKDTITDVGNFPNPVPKIYDLVRITGGLNGTTDYRRIIAVTANTIQVDTPFATQDAGFPFGVTVANTVANGTGITVTVNNTLLTDTNANFNTAGVQLGYTVVIEVGAQAGDRRQIVGFTATAITVDHPFSANQVGVTYRIDNPLNTYSNLAPLVAQLTKSKDILTTNVAPPLPAMSPVNSQKVALEAFFEYVVNDLLDPPTQAGAVNGAVLTGATDFVALGIVKGDLVYIETDLNGNAGFYGVVDPPPTTTTLTVDPAFPVVGAVSYRVVRPFGVNQKDTFIELFRVYQNALAYPLNLDFFKSHVQTETHVVVPGNTLDLNMFANALVQTDISDFAAVVDNRLNNPDLGVLSPTGPVAKIENILKNIEKLYNKRYAWIDARINLTTGYRSRFLRAQADRIQVEANLLNHLYKLLSTQGNG